MPRAKIFYQLAWSGRHLATAIFWLAGTLALAADETGWSPVSPAWAKIEENLGSVTLDGTLKLNVRIGEPDVLKRLGVRCALIHRIEPDHAGAARSVWRFSGLQSDLVPEGREHFRWRPLSGASVRFARATIERAFSQIGEARWAIRQSAADEFEIRGHEGQIWRYARGLLVAVRHPQIGEINFNYRQGLLREIILDQSDGKTERLLEITRDRSARIVAIANGAHEAHVFAWGVSGQLISYGRPDQTETQYEYQENRLSKITGADRSSQNFNWKENSGANRGDSKWPALVHLSRDGIRDYECTLSAAGIRLWSRDRDSGQEVLTVFNPRLRQLKQSIGRDIRVVFFRNESGGSGNLQRIETGDGEVLEEYRYDQRGKLVSILRKGDSERTLRYDEDGRIIALDISP